MLAAGMPPGHRRAPHYLYGGRLVKGKLARNAASAKSRREFPAIAGVAAKACHAATGRSPADTESGKSD